MAATGRFNIAIAGLGRVGALAATVFSESGDSIFRNHLSASLAAGADLCALIDPDVTARQSAADQLDSLDEVQLLSEIGELEPDSIDLLVIATPEANRLEQVRQALAIRPRMLLLEKPVAADVLQALEIQKLCVDIPVFVSFNRRLDPGMSKFAGQFPDSKPKAISFRYSKGMKNYASHIVDHIINWFGEVAMVQADPGCFGDPDADSVGFRCVLRSGLVVNVVGIPYSNYDMFEGELFFDEELHVFRNNGVEKACYSICSDMYYPDYRGLMLDRTRSFIQPIGGFSEIYQDLMENAGRKLCSLEEAVHGMKVLEASIQSAKAGGKVISLP